MAETKIVQAILLEAAGESGEETVTEDCGGKACKSIGQNSKAIPDEKTA